MAEPVDLGTGKLHIVGRISPASNDAFLVRVSDGDRGRDAGDADAGVQAIYKPVAGEQPLWDFPTGTLADREYAAYLVSEALGWRIVPVTVLRDGPHGPGMVQLWCAPEPGPELVDIVPRGAAPAGYLRVADGLGPGGMPVSVVHEASPSLRHIALFDAVVNNTDRKGGHLLPTADGHRWGIDHGLCFHHEDKLRTVLWGWAGEVFTDAERAALARFAAALDAGWADRLAPHLTATERSALVHRTHRLLAAGRFPEPVDDWPALPWPLR